MKYQKPKGQRIQRYAFSGITIYDNCSRYWYYDHLNNWIDEDLHPEVIGRSCSNYENCKSLKSAIRKVKKASVPKGTVFTLSSHFLGYDIDIVKK